MKVHPPREYIVVYRNDDRWEAHSSVVQLANGDVLVAFCETRAKEHEDFDSVYLVRSTDGGHTFDPATKTLVWQETEHLGSDIPLLAQLGDGTLIMNHLVTSFVRRKGILEDMGPQSEQLGRLRGVEGTWISRSHDNGVTWDAGHKVNTEPLRWAMPQDSVLELPDGILLMAVLGKMRTRFFDEEGEPWRSALVRSDNGGLDWEHWSTIAFDPAGIISFDEPALGRAADGTLVCMMRTSHLPRARHQHMWVAYSSDDGESWSRPEATNIWGYPADLVTLPDGRMVATYGYRRSPYGIRAVISETGHDWDVKNEIVLSEGGIGDAQRTPFWWHIGYPHSAVLHDGSLFTVYHDFTQDDAGVQQVVGVRWTP